MWCNIMEVTVFLVNRRTDIGVGSPENFSGRWQLPLGVVAIDPQKTDAASCMKVFLENQPILLNFLHLSSLPTYSQRASPSPFSIYILWILIDSVCLIIHYSSIIWVKLFILGFLHSFLEKIKCKFYFRDWGVLQNNFRMQIISNPNRLVTFLGCQLDLYTWILSWRNSLLVIPLVSNLNVWYKKFLLYLG